MAAPATAKKRMLSISIRWKIMSAMMAIAILVTIILGWFMLDAQKRYMKEATQKNGDFITESLSDQVAPMLLKSKYLEIRELLKTTQEKDQKKNKDILFIAVVDLIREEKIQVAVVGNRELAQEVSGTFRNEEMTALGQKFFVLYKPITIANTDDVIGYVRTGMSLDTLERNLAATRKSVFAFLMLGVSISLLMALVISNIILTPLRTLTQGIKRIAGGDFEHKIKIQTRDETGDLADSFNRMVGNLATLQDVSAIVTSTNDSEELIHNVVNRLSQTVHGDVGAMAFHGAEGEELSAGNIDDQAQEYLRTTRDEYRENPERAGDSPSPLSTSQLLVIPFYSEGEVTGGFWVSVKRGKIDEIDERLIQGVSSELESSLSKLEFQYRAVHDAMTKLYNHRYFQQELSRTIESAKRTNATFSIVMADIDNFKKLNDTYGHQQGDIVLKDVADAIFKTIRGNLDIPCRYGGEEFTIILPDTHLEGAKIFGERFRQAVEDLEFEFDGKSVKVSISMGIATYPVAAESKRDLIEIADRALYRAKESGKNCVKTYQDS